MLLPRVAIVARHRATMAQPSLQRTATRLEALGLFSISHHLSLFLSFSLSLSLCRSLSLSLSRSLSLALFLSLPLSAARSLTLSVSEIHGHARRPRRASTPWHSLLEC